MELKVGEASENQLFAYLPNMQISQVIGGRMILALGIFPMVIIFTKTVIVIVVVDWSLVRPRFANLKFSRTSW